VYIIANNKCKGRAKDPQILINKTKGAKHKRGNKRAFVKNLLANNYGTDLQALLWVTFT